MSTFDPVMRMKIERLGAAMREIFGEDHPTVGLVMDDQGTVWRVTNLKVEHANDMVVNYAARLVDGAFEALGPEVRHHA